MERLAIELEISGPKYYHLWKHGHHASGNGSLGWDYHVLSVINNMEVLTTSEMCGYLDIVSWQGELVFRCLNVNTTVTNGQNTAKKNQNCSYFSGCKMFLEHFPPI
jgi:hypothetical protein